MSNDDNDWILISSTVGYPNVRMVMFGCLIMLCQGNNYEMTTEIIIIIHENVLLEYLNTFVHLLCMHTKPRGGSRQGSKCSGGSLKQGSGGCSPQKL